MKSALFVLAACASTPAARPEASDAWRELTAVLPGAWSATSDDGTHVDVSFRMISGDSVLAETFGRPDHQTMTMYHRDHGELVATHYCAQGNQPRLRASSVAPHAVTLRIADVTDLDPKESVLVELDYALGAGGFDRVEVYRAPDGHLDRTRWHFTKAASS